MSLTAQPLANKLALVKIHPQLTSFFKLSDADYNILVPYKYKHKAQWCQHNVHNFSQLFPSLVPASGSVNTEDEVSAQIFAHRCDQKSSLYGCSNVSPSGGYIQ